MAKSKSFFGARRGSTKSHTYAHQRGWQITKDRQGAPTNPRSTAQMLQRMRVRMIQNAAAMLRPLISQSFEGVRVGEDSVREFLRLNQRKNAITPTIWVEKDSERCGVADFIVSNGSLGTLKFGDWNTIYPALINKNLFHYPTKNLPRLWDDDNGFSIALQFMSGLSDKAKLIFIATEADSHENAIKGEANNIVLFDLLSTNEDFIYSEDGNQTYYTSDKYGLTIGFELDQNDPDETSIIDITLEPSDPTITKYVQMAAFFVDNIGGKKIIQGTRLSTGGTTKTNDPLTVMQSYLK